MPAFVAYMLYYHAMLLVNVALMLFARYRRRLFFPSDARFARCLSRYSRYARRRGAMRTARSYTLIKIIHALKRHLLVISHAAFAAASVAACHTLTYYSYYAPLILAAPELLLFAHTNREMSHARPE